MYVTTIFLICVFRCLTFAQTSIEYSVNVGTVLFSHKDLQRSQWDEDEVGLLRARRHFQHLLPPPNFIDTRNNDYVNTLLTYFKDTYSIIKREASCPVADSLMTTAFSDALGGYMKLWVLPVSKLAFYEGTVSQDNIVKLYRFHNEIKRFLETDGKGWRSPDRNLLKSITINISPPRHITRSMKNPCKQLAYYEKTDYGLTIPIPHINWEDQSSTMFIPLKNVSLIPLDSPNHPNVLFKYYDTAKNCIEADADQRTAEPLDFDNRFQSWLDKSVVPHLSDEEVYLPLGSVLSLMNKTSKAGDEDTGPECTVIAGIPIDFDSMKIKIIGIILCLEVLWCIPALLCLFCARKKKKRQNDDFYTLLEACKDSPSSEFKHRPLKFERARDSLAINCPGRKKDTIDDKSCPGKDLCGSLKSCPKGKRVSQTVDADKLKDAVLEFNKTRVGDDDQGLKVWRPASDKIKACPTTGHKIKSKPHFEYKESDSRASRDSIGTDTHSYFGSNACSAVSIVHEAAPAPLKSSLKKVRSSHAAPAQQTTIIDPSDPNRTWSSVRRLGKSRKPTPEQSVRIESNTIQNSISATLSSLHQIPETLDIISSSTHVKSSSVILKKKVSSDIHSCCCQVQESTGGCACISCLESEVGSESTMVNQETNAITAVSDKNIEIDMDDTSVSVVRSDRHKIIKTKTLGMRVESGRPYLEIKIDKPQTEISVGICGTFEPLRNSRRSRIPKRLPRAGLTVQTVCTSPGRKELSPRTKSLIPQPKPRPVDDIVIKSTKPKPKRKDSKLNVTL